MRDEEITELFFARNESALEAAERKYGAYCLAVAENILHDKEDAAECLNSTLLGAWNAIPPEKPRNLKIYLAKLTRNLAVNRLKAKTAEKRGGGENEALLDELSECITGGRDVEEEFIAKELGESINRFIGGLPKKESGIFIRRYFFGEAPAEIAERFGISANGVSVILHRLRKKLRKELEREGYIQ